MKRSFVRLTWMAVAFALILSGCESLRSMSDSMKDRFARAKPRVHLVQGSQGAVYSAARKAMTRLGYQVSSGGRAEGRLEGFTQVGAGEGFQASYQRRIRVDFAPAGENSMDVKVMIYEIRTDTFGGPAATATETPLRDSAAYDAFFDQLKGQLAASARR